ncbi:MAG: ribbon-helix-helix domain-containing protein [Dongiaceae bacterium]
MTKSYHRIARVNARLPLEDARKLNRLAKAEGKSVSDIVRKALRRYYTDASAAHGSAADNFKRNKFIGCVSGDPDLSASYKKELRRTVAAKHGYR